MRTEKPRRNRQARLERDPLFLQIENTAQRGMLSTRSLGKSLDSQEIDEKSSAIDERLTAKILELSQEQRRELAESNPVSRSLEFPEFQDFPEQEDEDEDFVGEEEEEEDVTAEEEALLQRFSGEQSIVREGRTIADLIMEKLREQQESVAESIRAIPAKVVEVYTQVGTLLSRYRSGALPKALNVVPSLKNWEEILLLTKPDDWSLQAIPACCRLFMSMKDRPAQRFMNLVVLPKVRDNIAEYKKLNFHLYQALKKCVYRPAAFFKGIILPLAQESCSTKEAVIIGGLVKKVSLPVLHAGVALIKLCEIARFNSCGPVLLLINALLSKKYHLPRRVLSELVDFVCFFQEREGPMPVVWHQLILLLAQRYRDSIDVEQKDRIRILIKKHHHHMITPEIRRELFQHCSADEKMTE